MAARHTDWCGEEEQGSIRFLVPPHPLCCEAPRIHKSAVANGITSEMTPLNISLTIPMQNEAKFVRQAFTGELCGRYNGGDRHFLLPEEGNIHKYDLC